MSGKEFRLIKELTYSRLTAICAFEPPFFAYLLCGSLLNVSYLSFEQSVWSYSVHFYQTHAPGQWSETSHEEPKGS